MTLFTTRKQIGAKLIFFLLCYVIFYSIICDYLRIPKAISYVIDVVNITVFALMLFYDRVLTEIVRLRLQYILIASLVLLAAAWLTAILNAAPLLLVLWSTRNSMRFFPFFFSIILFWNKKNADSFSKFMFWLQIPNFFISMLQFFVLHQRGDNLGGLFGYVTGCNAFLYIFLLYVVTMVVQEYLHGKKSFLVMCATCLSSMLISALAELKVIFLVVPLIIIASFVLNKPTLRAVFLAVVISIGMVVAVYLVIFLFPIWADSFSSISALLDVAKMTGGGYNVPRLGAFSELTRLFFRGSPMKIIFGYGFGNCEYSSYDFLTTDFYQKYGRINYRWFSHMMWFLQTGYLGIVCYAIFIISVFLWITKMKKRHGDPDGIGSYGQIMCGLMIVNFVYNSSLTSEGGYLLFAFLALPFIYYKEIIYAKRRERARGVPAVPEELPEELLEAFSQIPPDTAEPEFFM